MFGCSASGGGFSCGCPQGYTRVGQGHCLTTVNPPLSGYDIGDAPTFPIDEPFGGASKDKLISTEGCFSCQVSSNFKFTGGADQCFVCRSVLYC